MTHDRARAPGTLPDWQGWNDRHLGLAIARCRLALAAHLAPSGTDAEAVRSDLARLASEQAATEAELRAAGQVPSLVALSERLGLSRLETDVVVLCLAAEIDADVAGMLSRPGRPGPHVTAGLAVALAGGAAPSAMLALSSSGVLAGLRIVEIAPDLPLAAAPLRLSPRVRDFLLGLDRLDEQAAGLLLPLEAPALPRALKRVVHAAAGAEATVLLGAPECGGRAVAAAAAALRGRAAVRLDPTRLPAEPAERDRAFALVARECALSRLVLVLDLHGVADASALAPLVRRRAGPVIVLAPTRAGLAAGVRPIALPPADPPLRAAMWRAVAPGLARADAEILARQFVLPPEIVARVAADVPEGRGRCAALWARAREEATPALAELGQRIVPSATWTDLVVPAETEVALREVAAAARARALVDPWGPVRHGARGEGLAVLLAGPSGTGKTLAAEVLAGTLALDLWRIDLSGVVSKWIGETEKNLRRVFDAAEAGGAVLFFDEADALFGKRTEVKDAHDRYANVEIAYLLQRMETYRGLSILATNLRANVDQAFLRRLRYVIDLPFPDEAARRAIWQRHIPPSAPTDGIDLDALARLDLPGGAIRNVALNAAAAAAASGEPIRMGHLATAARREFAKLGRLGAGLTLEAGR
jgi:hypothetical protein